MRAKAHQLKCVVVWLAIDQHQVGPDVAIAVIAPLAAERVIEIPPRRRLNLGQHIDGLHQQRVEAFGEPP